MACSLLSRFADAGVDVLSSLEGWPGFEGHGGEGFLAELIGSLRIRVSRLTLAHCKALAAPGAIAVIADLQTAWDDQPG